MAKQQNSDGLEEVRDEYFTVEEAFDKMGFGPFQLAMVFYTGTCWLADAMEIILLSFVGPAARCEWGLSSTQESLISSVVFLGLLLGSYSWGIVADIHGRRLGFLCTATVTVIFGLLSAWSPYYFTLLLFRFFVGMGIGGSPVVFSLCSEFLPASSRGFWLVFIEFFWTVGTIIESLIAWAVMPHLHWRVLVLLSVFPFLTMLLLYPLLPESPQFLMVRGDAEAALRVLQRVSKVNRKALPAGRLVFSSTAASNGSTAGEGMSTSTPMARSHSSKSPWRKVSKLLSKNLIHRTLIFWTINFANAFTYYGQVLLTTQLSGTDSCTENQTVTSASSLGSAMDGCTEQGQPVISSDSYAGFLVASCAELPGLLATLVLVDRIGRKASLSLSVLLAGVLVLPLLNPLPVATTAVLLFGARASITGSFAILWAYGPELYPTDVRSTGVGLGNAWSRLGGFFCPFVAVDLIASCHRYLAVGLLAIVPITAAGLSLCFPHESQAHTVVESVDLGHGTVDEAETLPLTA